MITSKRHFSSQILTTVLIVGSLNISFSKFLKAQESDSKFYDIKAGKIIYQFKIGPQIGQKILYFDNWGLVERIEIEITSDSALMVAYNIPLNLAMDQKLLQLRNNDSIFEIDLITQKGVRKIIPMQGLYNVPDISEFVPEQSDTIAGKICTIYQFKNLSKYSVWNKIYLKSWLVDIDDGEVAISVEELKETDTNLFKIPDGVIFR